MLRRLMRLFLASTDLPDAERDDRLIAELASLVPQPARVAIIVAAREEEPAEAFARERSRLRELGDNATLLDPRTDGAAVELSSRDLLWVSGGSLHALRAALRAGRLGPVVGARVRAGALVYAGASAGAIAAGPALYARRTLRHPSRRRTAPLWGELGLIDVSIVPHHPPPGAPPDQFSRIADHLRGRGCRCETLCDGEALIWADGRRRRIAG